MIDLDLAAAFILFILFMALSLLLDISMLIPLVLGFVLFAGLAVRHGCSVRDVLRMAVKSLHTSLIVVSVMVLIGCLTGLWRLSGTVSYFVVMGVSLMPPAFFILAAFLLAAAMSFALGTSFGVTATAGVILMSIAKAGNVDPVLSAAAVMSGVYVGDRGSPASSSANLVAALTGTDMRQNVRIMLKAAIVPFLLSCLFYALLSLKHPMQRSDSSTLLALTEGFTLGWYCLLPAVFMIVLPFCKVPVKIAMAISIVCAVAVAIGAQGCSFAECIKAALAGYRAPSAELAALLDGGGILSMLEVCGILLISGTYGSIFQETGMLSGITGRIDRIAEKTGRFPAMILLGVAACCIFCNQTIGAIMQNQFAASLYSKDEKGQKMIDMENSVITLAGMVPWCIACSVPLAMLGVGPGAIPFSFYLWLIPLWNLFLSFRKTK